MADETGSASLADSIAASLSAAGVDPNSDAPVVTSSDAPPKQAVDFDPLDYATNRFARQSAEDVTKRPDPLVTAATEGMPQAKPEATSEASQAAAPEGETEESTEANDQHQAVLRRFKELQGIDLTGKYSNDDEFLKAVANLNRLVGQRNEMAELGRVAMETPDRLLDLYRQRGILKDPEPKKEQTQQPTAPQPSPGGLEFKDDWLQYIEKGRIAPDTPAAVAKEINDYYAGRQILSHPAVRQLQSELTALKELVGKPAGEDPKQWVEQRLNADRAARWAEDIVTRNEDWIFTTVNGRRDLSPKGLAFRDALSEATEWGAPPDKALNYALKQVDLVSRPAPAAKPKNNGAAHKANSSPAKADGNDAKTALEATGGSLGAAILQQLGMPIG